MAIVGFVCFLGVFLAVGLLASRRGRDDEADYLLAGGRIPPLLTALSSVATLNSGFMFIGLIGFTYYVGISALWFSLGVLLGDFLLSFFVYAGVRDGARKSGALSFSELIAKWGGDGPRTGLRFLVGTITLVLLGVYAAAQLKAGGKALFVLFDWPEYTGILLGALVVLAYCLAGGLRASIWTDAVQAVIMLLAMGTLSLTALYTVGGIGGFIDGVAAISPDYASLVPPGTIFGPFLGPLVFLAGWFFGGFCASAQPHVAVRLMAMDPKASFIRMRVYYFSWRIAFSTLTITCGLAARVILPETTGFDPELALPTLTETLLPEILTGFILAGLFAATMSTADSQILSCSAVLAHDFTPKHKHSLRTARIGTLLIMMCALLIALFGQASVFGIVVVAFAALGSAFAPTLIVHALGYRPSERVVATMICTGLAADLLWWQLIGRSILYEALPGVLSGLAVFGISRLKHPAPLQEAPKPA